jgi:hypothetical protein
MTLVTVAGRDVELPDIEDPQAVFDFVINHLWTQRTRALAPDIHDDYKERCAYRGLKPHPLGGVTCCSVGALIPDVDYHPTLNSKQFTEDYPELIDAVFRGHDDACDASFCVLQDLQTLHDNYGELDPAGPDDAVTKDKREHRFHVEAHGVAMDHGLQYNCPDPNYKVSDIYE